MPLGAFKVFGALGALVELVEAVIAAVAAIVVFFRDNPSGWSSARFVLIAIILHVRFLMRSAFGNWVLALLYSFHIWMANGSFFCISSGLSRLAPPASFFQVGKKLSSSTPLRAAASDGEKSSLLSKVLADVRDWMVEEDPEESSERPGGNRTCFGEDDVGKNCGSASPPMAGALRSSERAEARRFPPRSPYCAPDIADCQVAQISGVPAA